MTAHVKDAGVWKPANAIHVKDAGVWKPVQQGYVKDTGVWKPFGSGSSSGAPNIYSASTDDTVRKIDPDGNEVWSFTGHGSTVRAVAVDSDGYVYSGSLDDTVRKIDPDGNEFGALLGTTTGSWP